MLTVTNLKFAFYSVDLICKIGVLPLKIDLATGKLCVNKSRWSWWMSKGWQYLFLLRVVHIVSASGFGTFFSDNSDSEGWTPEETPMLIVACVVFSCVSFISFKFNPWQETIVILWNFAYEFLTGQNGENKSNSKRITFQEMFLRYFPFLLYSCIITFPFFYMVIPQSKFLFIRFVELFYGTGEGEKISLGIYAISLVVDMIAHLYFLCFVNFLFYFVCGNLMSAKQKSSKNINELRWKITRNGEEHHQLVKSSKVLTTLHLQVSMFNISTSAIICLSKVVVLTIGIFCGFAFVRLFAKGSPLAVIHIMLFLNAVIDYTIIFNDAYQATENIHELQEIIKMRTRRAFWSEAGAPSGPDVLPGKRTQWKRYQEFMKEKELNRIARAVPRLSIKSGDVATFERNFTLEFNSFVAQKIVDLLLTT